MKSMKVALYVRVSRLDQNPDNQIAELRRYVRARDWKATEFIERGISGSKDRRPQLDAMMKDVKRKRFDAVVCWKLDRLGRDMRHLRSGDGQDDDMLVQHLVVAEVVRERRRCARRLCGHEHRRAGDSGWLHGRNRLHELVD